MRDREVEQILDNLGGYEVIEKIGEGGMAGVFLARDCRLNRHVALKVLLKGDSNLSSLINEARSLARVNHINVVHVYDVIELTGGMVIVMEYVQGMCLHHLILKPNQSLQDKVDVLLQMARGIQAIHQAGIIHSDLKPSNVIVADNGIVKILDLGIAQQADDRKALPAYGTCLYASPEQLENKPLSYQSDLFSYGIVAFEFITGVHPFGTTENVLKNIKSGKVKHANQMIPPPRPELSEMFNILLNPNPTKRPDSCSWVVELLESVQKRLALEGASGEQTVALTDIQKKANWPKRLAVTSLVSGAVLVCLVAAYMSLKGEAPPRYVLVKTPFLIENSGTVGDFESTLIASMDDALRQHIIADTQLQLLPDTLGHVDVENVHVNAERAGATDVLLSELVCSETYCEASYSLLSQSEQGGPWVVASQKSGMVTTHSPLEVYNATRESVAWLLPTEQSSDDNFHSAATYATYINLYKRFWFNNEYSDALLMELDSFSNQNPYMESVYSLYRSVAMNMFHESGDKHYLTKIEQRLNAAPSEFKSGLSYAVDMFSVYMARRDFSHAQGMLELVELRGGGEALLAETYGRLFLAENKLKQARESYARAVNFRPSASNLYGLAYTYYAIGDLERAETTLVEVRTLSPEFAPAIELLANTYLLREKLVAAIEQYLALIDISPHSNYQSNLSIAYMLKREFSLAHYYAEAAVQQSPDNVYWLLNLADIKKIMGDKEGSHALYRKILAKIEPEDAASLLIAAQANAHIGNYQTAIEQVNMSKKLAPNNGEGAFNAAIVYSIAGEHLSAITQIKDAISLDISRIWFTLPWFEGLCGQSDFGALLDTGTHGTEATYIQTVCGG